MTRHIFSPEYRISEWSAAATVACNPPHCTRTACFRCVQALHTRPLCASTCAVSCTITLSKSFCWHSLQAASAKSPITLVTSMTSFTRLDASKTFVFAQCGITKANHHVECQNYVSHIPRGSTTPLPTKQRPFLLLNLKWGSTDWRNKSRYTERRIFGKSTGNL